MTKLIEKTAPALKTKANVTNEKLTVASKVTGKPLKEKSAPKGWRIKNYFVDLAAFAAAKTELEKAPNQVKIMMNHFASKFNKAELAAQGRTMCESAINEGGLKTVIEPHVLFAYYRKIMEGFGLRLRDN